MGVRCTGATTGCMQRSLCLFFWPDLLRLRGKCRGRNYLAPTTTPATARSPAGAAARSSTRSSAGPLFGPGSGVAGHARPKAVLATSRNGERDRDGNGSPPTPGPARCRGRTLLAARGRLGTGPGRERTDLGTLDQKLPRAAPREFRVHAVHASLRDLQRGPVHLNGAGMLVTRSCRGGHQCCVASQHFSVSGGPVDDEVEVAAVVGWDAC